MGAGAQSRIFVLAAIGRIDWSTQRTVSFGIADQPALGSWCSDSRIALSKDTKSRASSDR